MTTLRLRARQVSCPKCSAAAGEPCVSKKGKRKSVHQERVSRRAKATWIPERAPSGRSFYSSDAWIALRYRALAKHGNRCQCCGATPSDGISIHVDHIKPRSKYPNLALEMNNIQILCKPCNVGKSNIDDTDWRAA